MEITDLEYCKLFRKQSKFVKFVEFLFWCETDDGKKWVINKLKGEK